MPRAALDNVRAVRCLPAAPYHSAVRVNTALSGADTAVLAANLTKTYAGGIEAVRGIDLHVRKGEVFGFLGPNGAGKTTAVRMLTTLLPITSGVAEVAGHDVGRDPGAVRTAIGVALQEAGLDPLQTGREVLELQCGLFGVSNPKKRAEALLGTVGLTEAGDRRTKTYSGGMKRRLDLATALAHQPEVLFLDEPTTGLDPASRAQIWSEVRRINAEGATVFLTTQYLEEADQLCDRLAIIDHGMIISEGTPEELKSALGDDVVTVGLIAEDIERAAAAFAGDPNFSHVSVEETGLSLSVGDGAGAVARVVRALDGAGVDPQSITVSRPTLDDVFLQATGRRLEGSDRAAGTAGDQPPGGGGESSESGSTAGGAE